MYDREFLLWLAARIVNNYGESPDVDFVGKLTSIAVGLPKNYITPNTENFTNITKFDESRK